MVGSKLDLLREDVRSEDCKISDARLMRYCGVDSSCSLPVLPSAKLAPSVLDRLSNSLESFSKKENVKSGKMLVLLMLLLLMLLLLSRLVFCFRELLRERTGVGSFG